MAPSMWGVMSGEWRSTEIRTAAAGVATLIVALTADTASAQQPQWPGFGKDEWATQRAQVLSGTELIDGRGAAPDFDAGVKLIEGAAAAGYVPARYVLTFVYAEGFGTAPNALEAVARLQGPQPSRSEAEALFTLGLFYAEGFRFPKEDQPVVAWALTHMGVDDEKIRQYFDAQRVHHDYAWAAPDRATAWYQKGAEAGHIGAQVNLGLLLLGAGTPDRWDCAEGLRWMRTAADRGDATAQLNLGSLYLRGPDRTVNRIGITMVNIPEGVRIESVEPDGAGGRAGLRAGDRIISANRTQLATYGLEDLRAIVETGRKMTLVLKRAGEDATQSIDVTPEKITLKCPGAENAGLRQDSAEAFRWFETAANGGHASGLFFLARAHREGTGTPRNPEKALELYRQGAGRGDWQAAQEISHMYAAGEGVEKNQQLAEEWFRRALQLKHRSIGRN